MLITPKRWNNRLHTALLSLHIALSLSLSVILPPSCSGTRMNVEKERTLKVNAAPGEHWFTVTSALQHHSTLSLYSCLRLFFWQENQTAEARNPHSAWAQCSTECCFNNDLQLFWSTDLDAAQLRLYYKHSEVKWLHWPLLQQWTAMTAISSNLWRSGSLI